MESVSGNGIGFVMFATGTDVAVGSGVGTGVAVGSGVGVGGGVAVGAGVFVGTCNCAREAPGWVQAANSSITSDMSRYRNEFFIVIC